MVASSSVLNYNLGWSEGDDLRVCISSGLNVSRYQLQALRVCMNDLGETSSGYVSAVLDLLDQYEEANSRMIELNSSGGEKVLVKADVLEWETKKSQDLGAGYSPEREIMRIRGLLAQYLGACMFDIGEYGTSLVRS